MKKIKLTQNKYAIVDDEDFERLNKHKWCANKGWAGYNFYALRSIYDKKTKKSRNLLMHRDILNLPKGAICDHINRNGLDNRKKNLRSCTVSENAINSRLRSDNKSGHRGVFWEKSRKKWYLSSRRNGKKVMLGRYDNKEEAIRVYKLYVTKYDENINNR